MELYFDMSQVVTVEFGIGLDEPDAPKFFHVPSTKEVQQTLIDMVVNTVTELSALDTSEQDPEPYEPSEKYASEEHTYLPINNPLAGLVKELHESNNLDNGGSLLVDQDADVFCYFVKMTDASGRRLTAVRRASGFNLIGRKRRLIVLVSDAVELAPQPLFKLDNDFDLVVDDRYVHILRAAGFEAVGRLKQAILDSVDRNITEIEQSLPFLDVENIKEYASGHVRAARYLASIRAQGRLSDVDPAKLKAYCERQGVQLIERDGKLIVENESAMNFLLVLDRRLYDVDWFTNGEREQYVAHARRRSKPHSG